VRVVACCAWRVASCQGLLPRERERDGAVGASTCYCLLHQLPWTVPPTVALFVKRQDGVALHLEHPSRPVV